MSRIYYIEPCVVAPIDGLEHGDVFTIYPDKSAKGWELVADKIFMAVPEGWNSDAKKAKKWANRIKTKTKDGAIEMALATRRTD